MADNEKLAEYQDALLELLSCGLSQEQIIKELKSDPRFQHYRDYVCKFDPDMVEVARELMGKWAQRVGDM